MGSGWRVARSPPSIAAGTVVGPLPGRGGRRASGCGRGSRSWPALSTPSRASTAPAWRGPATRWTRAARPAGSACTGTDPLVVPGSFSTTAPLPGLYSVGGAMAATGRAVDWFRVDVLRGAATTETLIEEAGSIPAGADGVVFLPYLAGERSPLWDPSARGAFVGLGAGPRPGAPHPGDPRGVGVRDPPCRRVDPGGRRGRSARCGSAAGRRRSETWNQIKADVTGFSVEVAGRPRDRRCRLGDRRGHGVGAWPDVPAAIRGMTRTARRLSSRPGQPRALRRDVRRVPPSPSGDRADRRELQASTACRQGARRPRRRRAPPEQVR